MNEKKESVCKDFCRGRSGGGMRVRVSVKDGYQSH